MLRFALWLSFIAILTAAVLLMARQMVHGATSDAVNSGIPFSSLPTAQPEKAATSVVPAAEATPAATPPDQAPAGWYGEVRDLYYGIPVTVKFTPVNESLAKQAWALLASFDDNFNDYRADSAIGRINAGGVGDYQLNPMLEKAFALSEQMRDETGGVFDVSVGPLRHLWRGAEAAKKWPTQAEIAQARANIGPHVYRRVGNTLTKLVAGARFDFGGVCKGMAVDQTVALLGLGGCTAGMVQVGGETGCWGMSPKQRPHRFAIRDPDAPDDPARFSARIQDPGGRGMSNSTSGNYFHPIQIQGKTLYHVYDPRTGMPAPTTVLSSTIIFPGTGRNGEADALAKTGELLEEKDFFALVARRGGEALLLKRGVDGAVVKVRSPGLDAYLLQADPASSAGQTQTPETQP